MTAGDPEAAYYQAVEEFFVARRGDPLFLSSADWLLVRKWRRAGLPLRVVLRGIGDALEDHRRSWGRNRKVGSLRYCAAEVERARERWERALSLGQEAGADLGGFLRGLAESLEAARDTGPRVREHASRLAGSLRELAREPPPTRRLEAWLAKQEALLLSALREDAGAGPIAQAEAAADAELAPYRERLPERVLAQVREEAVVRRLLARHGLPRLSLFGL